MCPQSVLEVDTKSQDRSVSDFLRIKFCKVSGLSPRKGNVKFRSAFFGYKTGT